MLQAMDAMKTTTTAIQSYVVTCTYSVELSLHQAVIQSLFLLSPGKIWLQKHLKPKYIFLKYKNRENSRINFLPTYSLITVDYSILDIILLTQNNNYLSVVEF